MKYEPHDILAVGIGLILAGCTATFISVRKSDNTTISTESNMDSIKIGGGQWDWEDNDSINFDLSKDKRHYKNDSLE